MDLNAIVGRIARLFARRAAARGLQAALRRGHPPQPEPGGTARPAPGGADLAKRLRQGLRLARRIGR
ncbi:MAG: hypothetical protein KJZ85_13640 [Rhodobacteraceae bacterium]|jgi:hypothetical protein|nr:hypothetical protein [Paracoccaceae bacterium]